MFRYTYWLLLAFGCTAAWADYSVDFLRITCIPETRYFEIEYRAVPGDAVFIGAGFEEQDIRQRLDIWKKRGYYDPSKLRYECKLPDSTYLLTSTRPPASERGMCGGAPRITLNLSRNGEPWLDNVVFGADCFGGPTITRIAIRDGQDGWDTRNADVCISPSGDSDGHCEYLSETGAGITGVMPLTQKDVEQYVEATRTERQDKKADSKIRVQHLPLTKFKQETCEFPNLKLPSDAIVYAVGDYGYLGKPLGYQIDQSAHEARRIDVTVNEPNKPVVLLLGAYEPMVWNINWTPRSRIVAVLASGRNRQAVSGLPKGIPLLTSQFSKKPGPCKPFYVVAPTSNDHEKNKNKDEINKLATEVFGRSVSHISLPNKDGSVILGEPIPAGVDTVTSSDTMPDSFFNPKAPLAGKAGLDDGVKKGLLRKATAQDAAAWKEGKSPLVASTGDKPSSQERGNSYVVLKPFKFPGGLFGAYAAEFFVPKGVPAPEGERGHSTVYDFGTMRCVGPMCGR